MRRARLGPALSHTLTLSLGLGLLAGLPARADDGRARDEVAAYEEYRQVVAATAGMVGSPAAQDLAARHGLTILNVTWEDTGRFENSAVGPNISDMTIQVQQMDPRNESFNLTCMPVIRYPNFADLSADLSPDRFFVLVGNEKGKDLRKVSLRELLGDLRSCLSVPGSWKGERKSLLAPRDTHVLVSAQACFLPVPQRGKAEFNPVLFNYQSMKANPAVLTILATREGTSITIIDNVRDAFAAGGTWGQRLFFNKHGERASFTGERLSDFRAAAEAAGGATGPAATAAGQAGLNLVLLIQVPLKHKEILRPNSPPMDGMAGGASEGSKGASPSARGSDVEAAVIGHGRVEGPYTEIDGLEIERDERFPVRVTVQFYKATSNGVVAESDVAEIAAEIKQVYAEADYVGSLVTGGRTGRPTEHDGPQTEPPNWWSDFWTRYEQNTGITRSEALLKLARLMGRDWTPTSEAELAAALARLEGK